MIDKNDRLKVPKRLYIMDYQLEPCKIDGISDSTHSIQLMGN